MKPVCLIGPMGAGKSVVGKALSETVGGFFIDLDEYIVQHTGKSIPEIFESNGESYFRDLESSSLKECLDIAENSNQPYIISCGGGIAGRRENREQLRTRSFCIYLFATVELQYARVNGDSNRPMLKAEDVKKRLETLFALRDPLFRETAHSTVFSKQGVPAVVSECCRLLREAGYSEKARIELKDHSYDIIIGRALDIASSVRSVLSDTKDLMIVSNETVAPLYMSRVSDALSKAGFNCRQCILKDGESYKTIDSYMQIMSALLEAGFGRDCALLALGGGVIGDMTGFAAATYQRGVTLVQLPTTLLSMVDSSVGGKTAVNHPAGKNMIGAFHQPALVTADISFLDTLNEREKACGMAEVIKYAVLFDNDFFTYLREHAPLSEEQGLLDSLDTGYVVKQCCLYKAAVVTEDEKEKGSRALLNLGHTFGHAVEVGMGFGTYLHGESIAVGMALAAYVSLHEGMIDRAYFDELISLIKSYRLPVAVPDAMSVEDFMKYMHHDKKVRKGRITYVLPAGRGKCVLRNDLSDEKIASYIAAYRAEAI